MVTEENKRLVLRTQRLILRGTTMDDVPAIHAVQNNPATIRYLRPKALQAIPYPIEAVREVIEDRIQTNHLHMVIYLLPEEKHLSTPEGHSPYDANLEFPSVTSNDVCGELIGSVGFLKDYEIGYAIRYEEWGKGIAPEATAGMLREIWKGAAQGRYGTLPKGLPEGADEEREYVGAAIEPRNRGSARVLEKVGGVVVGTKEVEDWDQTPEERERDGARIFNLQFFRVYRPASVDSS